MTHFPSISVIIPVYNTAPWLRRCLDSVCGQTLRDIEIICVNDGSSDESGEILKEYADRDSRVLPITLGRNQGISVARNVGMAAACGEWLGFVDSDDTVAPDFYEKLHAAAMRSGAEIVKGSVILSDNVSGRHRARTTNSKIIQNQAYFNCEFWSAIYNTQFIKENNIFFLNRCIRGNDKTFLLKAVNCSKSIDIANNAVYYYCRRDNSTDSKILDIKKIKHTIMYVEYCIDMLNKYFNHKTYNILFTSTIFDLFIQRYRFISDERDEACHHIAESILRCMEKCRDYKNILFLLNKRYTGVDVLIDNKDIEDLAKFLSLDCIQRLRRQVKMQFINN